jgi:hypothetical protein
VPAVLGDPGQVDPGPVRAAGPADPIKAQFGPLRTHDAGFGDLSYFNRTFRHRYGVTPSGAREPTPG